jgi:hypothetical protein
MENATVTSVPEITRMIARIEDWKEGHGKARGRAETERVLGDAHNLFEGARRGRALQRPLGLPPFNRDR